MEPFSTTSAPPAGSGPREGDTGAEEQSCEWRPCGTCTWCPCPGAALTQARGSKSSAIPGWPHLSTVSQNSTMTSCCT